MPSDAGGEHVLLEGDLVLRSETLAAACWVSVPKPSKPKMRRVACAPAAKLVTLAS
jgi:hypothetical protein